MIFWGGKVNTKIIVAAHKSAEMPTDSELYYPVFVGKALHPELDLPYHSDNDGLNISEKNPNYNELTAVYWAWKNIDAEAYGLVHYRRYLSLNKNKNLNSILTKEQVDDLLEKNDIILPKKRNYFIESNYSHYIHSHQQEPIDVTRLIIAENFPEYLDSFDKVMKKTSAHIFNIFIMKKKPFNEYCEWMFDILNQVESRIDISEYDAYESRVYGFISELLLDTWLNVNSSYQTTEVNFVYMEKQNWLKKGYSFLWRKFKYVFSKK